ncbi:DNA helicase-2 / ATP-dependent DNA helicase PcrA [Ruminococcaceae bacterium P7]|nr:DNA helicase-2 / ATP-dependent DNA helicase PcrA [Ruminococcaceae bacterium P7]
MTQSELKQQFSFMNDMQQQAVFATEGPVLILAGAGSGKTTVLVNRISYILQSGLCNPWNILAITFTNKAAGELKERICNTVPEGGSDIWAATFHSTCARILRRYGDRLGYSSHFTVYSTDDQKRLVKDIIKQLQLDEHVFQARSVLTEISRAKDKMLEPKDLLKNEEFDFRASSIAKIYEIYQAKLKTSDAMDFDDLLCNAVKLFRQEPEILGFYQNQFKYIMVDEYQDTNKVQYQFVSMLAQKYGNICVVGDDDQSIYKFRGATIENILSFENTFKGAKVIRLEQNYRSTQNILDAANAVIANNNLRKGKTLWTQNPKGDNITVHTCDSERDEAAFVTRTIMDGVADGRKYSDFAILYRTNAQSNALEQALSRSGVPHRIIGGHRFYDREEIRDMVAYLQVINNPHDDVRLSRIINVPKRSIGAKTVSTAAEIAAGLGESIYTVIKDADAYPQLSRAAAKLKAFTELIDGLIEAEQSEEYSLAELYNLILEHTNYENYLRAEKENADVRIENIEELSSNIIKFEEDYGDEADLSNFLEEISLMTDIDNYDADADTCVMMTLHSAKGLEFPVVFITGMEDGLFPSMAAISSGPDELDEERRLAYVGITRAKRKLYLTKTKTRMLFGSTTYSKESRFVSEIPAQLVERTGESRLYGSSGKSSPYSASAGAGAKVSIGVAQKQGYNPSKFKGYQPPAAKTGVTYKVGDSVLHKLFGKGLILSAEKMGNDTLLEIAFDKAGTKKLMANFCKMEKL